MSPITLPEPLLREAIGELKLWADAHEEAGEEFCLNRAAEIRQIVRRLDDRNVRLRERRKGSADGQQVTRRRSGSRALDNIDSKTPGRVARPLRGAPDQQRI
jgi:hypothetical protein